MSDALGAMASPHAALSKSSIVSPLSSPGNSVHGSPPQTSMAAHDSDDSRALSDSASSPFPLLPTAAALLTPPASLSTPATPAAPAAPAPSRGGLPAPQRTASHLTMRVTPPVVPPAAPQQRRASFGLGFLSSLLNSIRGGPTAPSPSSEPHAFMSNSPTIANLSNLAAELSSDVHVPEPRSSGSEGSERVEPVYETLSAAPENREQTSVEAEMTRVADADAEPEQDSDSKESGGKDKDGFFSVRLTPIIDHSSSNTGLYFSPVIRRIKPDGLILIGRYTEKNKSAAHAPQGSQAPVVFKSKVVSRTHAMFQCNEEGLWFLKDCKSSSGTFLNNIRLSQASQELTLWPLIDGDIVQLGLDYRGGTEEVYRCVKMRCEFNRSWQRKVNQFNLDIHKKMRNLGLESSGSDGTDELSECAICLLKLEPCQAIFVSPCSHTWHYKCIRPIIIKSYPQFYCPNCRSMCDLETDIEDDE